MATIAAGAVNLAVFNVTLPEQEDFVFNIWTQDGSDWPDGTGATIELEPVGADAISWTATLSGSALSWYVANADLVAVRAANPKLARLQYVNPAGQTLLWGKGNVYAA